MVIIAKVSLDLVSFYNLKTFYPQIKQEALEAFKYKSLGCLVRPSIKFEVRQK